MVEREDLQFHEYMNEQALLKFDLTLPLSSCRSLSPLPSCLSLFLPPPRPAQPLLRSATYGALGLGFSHPLRCSSDLPLTEGVSDPFVSDGVSPQEAKQLRDEVKHNDCSPIESIKVEGQITAHTPVFYRLDMLENGDSSVGYIQIKEFNAQAKKDLVIALKRLQDSGASYFVLDLRDNLGGLIQVSSKQLRDDLMTMLIAGHETSAAVLTWTFYLLSKEPEVVAKLQEEVDRDLGDRMPTIDDMKKLVYTRVINESLRLYPQPPVLIRRSMEDDVLDDYPIGKGEDIFISIWNLHRCPKNWTDADKFKPERWPLDEPNPNEINQNLSYLPFGGGPRKCVGDMFATFETVVATTMLVRRFNFQLAPGAPPVEMTTGATIHTTEGLKMTVTRRTMPPIIPNLETKVASDSQSTSFDQLEVDQLPTKDDQTSEVTAKF